MEKEAAQKLVDRILELRYNQDLESKDETEKLEEIAKLEEQLLNDGWEFKSEVVNAMGNMDCVKVYGSCYNFIQFCQKGEEKILYYQGTIIV